MVEDRTRRDFIYIATGGFGAIGLGAVTWPLFAQMSPAADTKSNDGILIDVSKIKEGQ